MRTKIKYDKYNENNLLYGQLPLKIQHDIYYSARVEVMNSRGFYVDCEDPQWRGNMIYRTKKEVDA
jgi:hypothetical protein